MVEPETDRDLLEETWRLYAAEFDDHVGGVVTPYEYVETRPQVDWAARVFMFGYALGSLAGAHAAAPDRFDGTADRRRVEDAVDAVVEINGSGEFDASAERISETFRTS